MSIEDELVKKIALLERALARERNARLQAETTAELGLRALHDRQQLSALFERIVTGANTAQTVLEALRLALTEICEHSGALFGNLQYVSDGIPSMLVPSTLCYVSSAVDAGDAERIRTEACFPPSGIAERTLAAGAPLWIKDLAPAGAFWDADARAKSATPLAFDCGFGCPLMIGNRVAAVIECHCDASSVVSDGFLEELGRIGIHLGQLIERESAMRGLNYRALHDELTGFYNRAQFARMLQLALRQAAEGATGRPLLLSLDVDRFGSIDQTLGYLVGDEVILEISRRLQKAVDGWMIEEISDIQPLRAIFARSGRDEFMLLLEGATDIAVAEGCVNAVYAALLPTFLVKGQNIRLSISGGLVEWDFQSSAEDMMRNADLTTRRAKALGGGQWLRFDNEMHRRAMDRLKMESDLSNALENNQFRLLYQPIYALDCGKIVGFEALLRWQRTEDHLELPNEFIGLAEETGHVVKIGAWAIREACRALGQLQLELPRDPPLFVSINVSPRQFRHSGLANQFREAIAENWIRPETVHLEVTESITIDDVERTALTLKSLQAVGVCCGIDDFGTGYSSLNYLHELPFDTLKIDRSFVARLGEPGKSREIVQTLIGLAKHLKMSVIAEGIETEFQLATLLEMGCEMGQGYLLSRPMSLEAAFEILEKNAAGLPNR